MFFPWTHSLFNMIYISSWYSFYKYSKSKSPSPLRTVMPWPSNQTQTIEFEVLYNFLLSSCYKWYSPWVCQRIGYLFTNVPSFALSYPLSPFLFLLSLKKMFNPLIWRFPFLIYPSSLHPNPPFVCFKDFF